MGVNSFPAPGTVLWAMDVDLARDVFRSGAAWKKVDKRHQKKINWWGIEQNRPIPTGLSLLYDGQPPGHCTLTVTRSMTVSAFLKLVALVPFSPQGIDLVGPIH